MKVSIVTVTYNSSETLLETLNSVGSQFYSDIEHIIIDGASNDDTIKIVKEYGKVSKWISEPDNGIYDAMNKGIELATGDIIGILNSDDLYKDSYVIGKVVSLFQKRSEIYSVYSNLTFFKNNFKDKVSRKWVSKPYYNNFFEHGQIPPHPTLFVKRKVYDTIGLYYPNFKIASDYEFMLRMLKVCNYKSFYFDEVFVRMRLGGNSTKGLKSLYVNNKEVLKSWRMNNLKPPLKFFIMRPLVKILQLLRKYV